ncbi:MAG: NAD(+) synthase [Alphaproteobacteria bacterium]|nr:NAD(+) synthase [Alphaproteobacteria bacterium]
MTKPVLIALAQMNAHLGKVNANVSRLAEARAKSALQGAEIIVTPEMFLSGYPCDDLVLRNDFMADVAAGIDQLTELTSDGGPAIVVGAPAAIDGAIYNSVFVLDGGKQLARFDKVNLPNYGVFDDKRNFTAGQMPGPAMLRGLKIGFPICEDIWEPNVAECLEESGADLIIAINASPFDISKPERRMSTIVARTVETGLPVAYVNMVGGQDELVYDGSSFAINAGGKLACHLPSFSESIVVISAQKTAGMVALTGQITPPDSDLTALYRGLCLGLRDYVHKNGFPGVLLGLSGGIDSALVAALAVDALGTMLADQFAGTAPNVAEENIQSRLRGLILMGISNKHGAMVLATGNKSEYAAGYSTLYGDMCGGYAPLKDVWKVDVFRLCEWRNRHLPRGAAGPEGVVIPQAIIDKPPSAELRPDQKDTDSLPPYDQLDAIMAALCEEMADIETIVARGYNRDDVTQASQLLFRAEYKRFQAAPGPKMTPVAFGRDRRLPLTSGFNPIKR